MSEPPDDTSLRHEVRWICASLPTVPEQVSRVREALTLMSESVRVYELDRIREKIPAWHKALNEETA